MAKRRKIETKSSSTGTTSAQFEELSDDIASNFLSFCNFKERTKCRAVCSRMKTIVDSMPGAETLKVRLLEGSPDNDATATFEDIFSWESDTSTVTINLFANTQILFLNVLLKGTSIRFGKLHLETAEPYSITKSAVQALTRQSACHDVDELSLYGLTLDSAVDIRQSFPHIRKLTLLGSKFPLQALLLMVTGLKNLTTLHLELTEETIESFSDRDSIGMPLSVLSSLPNLTNLTISWDEGELELFSSAFGTTIFPGLSAITQLKVLKLVPGLICLDESTAGGFGKLLYRLTNLEELSEVMYPDLQHWNAVRAAGAHNLPLRKLGIYTSEASSEKLAALATACVELFPSLTHLEMEHENYDLSVGETTAALLSLRNHPSLRHVFFVSDDHSYSNKKEPWDENDFRSRCQALFGENIVLEHRLK